VKNIEEQLILDLVDTGYPQSRLKMKFFFKKLKNIGKKFGR
jgi:hypothetical protein